MLETKLQRKLRADFEKALQPLAKNFYKSLDCYSTHRNNNILIMGPPGSNKSRGVIIPAVLQAVGSMVISDPKGSLFKRYGPYLKSKGYKVKNLSFIELQKPLHYNPMKFIKKSSDIRKLAYAIIYASGGTYSPDPYWDKSATTFLSMVIAYVFESNLFPEEVKNLNTVNKIISSIRVGEEDISDSSFARDIEKHRRQLEAQGRTSYAYREYEKVLQTPHKTICTIISTIHSATASMDSDEIMELLEDNDIDFEAIGKEPTALFVSVSDTDRSLDSLASIFFTQLFNELCLCADKAENQMLPIPTRIIMDDFATNVKIPDFDSILSNIRSRAISAIIVCQSESQLHKQYGEAADTIIDDCDTIIYMGANSVKSAEQLAERANIPVHKALEMPVGTCYIFEHGEKPVFANSIDLDKYIAENNIELNPEKTNRNGGRS